MLCWRVYSFVFDSGIISPVSSGSIVFCDFDAKLGTFAPCLLAVTVSPMCSEDYRAPHEFDSSMPMADIGYEFGRRGYELP
jgi:hypothetical protein